MRIFGLILIIVGIAFGVLFTFALLGGGEDLLYGFFVAGVLIFMGWQLRVYGKGIRQQEPTSDMSEARPDQMPPLEFPTTELPVTPAVSAAFMRQVARWRRTTAIVLACGVGFFVVLAVGMHVAVGSPTGTKTFLIVLAVTVPFFVLLVGGIHLFQRERPVRSDLRASTYLRTSGPVQVVSVSGGRMLRMADRA
ncbi:MAG: hypothetical protein P8182_12505, partial [Deltaproteobacteria bacterium]